MPRMPLRRAFARSRRRRTGTSQRAACTGDIGPLPRHSDAAADARQHARCRRAASQTRFGTRRQRSLLLFSEIKISPSCLQSNTSGRLVRRFCHRRRQRHYTMLSRVYGLYRRRTSPSRRHGRGRDIIKIGHSRQAASARQISMARRAPRYFTRRPASRRRAARRPNAHAAIRH